MNFQIEQQRRGSSSCMTWGLILGGILVCVVILPLVCCGGFGYFAFDYMTAPMQATAEELEQSQEVVERLGTPIEVSYQEMQLRNFNSTNGNGSAEIEATFTGPEGSARVKAKLDQRDEEWSVNAWEATFPDDSVLKGGNDFAPASEGTEPPTEPESETGAEEITP